MRLGHIRFSFPELLAIVVVVGTVVITAVPSVLGLRDEAKKAKTEAMAGSIESASSLNYAVAMARDVGLTSERFHPVTDCSLDQINRLLPQKLDKKDFSISVADGDYSASRLGDTETCRLTGPDSSSADFILIHIGHIETMEG